MTGRYSLLTGGRRGRAQLDDAALVAAARRSLVSITAGALRGTGFIALGNGVVLTSRRAIGYQLEVVLGLEDGRRVLGRVIAAHVELDVAFILPAEPLSLAPLPLRTEPGPKLGELVLLAGLLAGEGPVFLPLMVGSECRGPEAARLFGEEEVDRALHGAPVIDEEGRVVGLCALRGARRLMPVAQFARELRALDVPTIELAHREPIYRCPKCAEPFTADDDRCLSCGVPLPHDWSPSPARAGAERVIKDCFLSLGIVANKVRIGPRTWRVQHRAQGGEAAPSEVTVRIDEEGLHAVFSVPVARVPEEHYEPFFRLLLTMNDQTAGLNLFSLAADVVVLSLIEPIAQLLDRDVPELFHEIVRIAEQYRRSVAEPFGAEPIRDGLPLD